jgi:hypothetical protein
MEKEDIFGELISENEESFEKILLALLDKENLTMKTEIQKPLNLTRLYIFGAWLKAEKMDRCSQLIDSFIQKYLEFMVSNKRQSRKEIIQALTEGMKSERTLREKLTEKPA